jgi:acetoin utilization deacetylase AcuC-like enzyme
MPIAREFQPDLVLVSAGFDAALGDMGECNVTPECFGRLTRSLMTLANGKVVCALEGGYVRSVLAKCVESVVTNLLDCTSPQVSETETKEDVAARDGVDVLDTIDNSAAKSILATIAAHESYWPCLGK